MDEFRIRGYYLEDPNLVKYPPQGGWVQTEPLDLGEEGSRILRVEAFGGRTSNQGGILKNEYRGNKEFRYADDSALQFFIRAGDSPYAWTDEDWLPLNPGEDFAEGFTGRYVQLSVIFYPSGDNETSPYLDELKIIYLRKDPPQPPSLVTAFARDGAVDLAWKASSNEDVTGYLVYYGTASGEYFGDRAILEAASLRSPIDVGNLTSFRIEGLRNGTLYFFAVAAYNKGDPPKPGDFSREATARPLRGLADRR
jgi:hypothetical protein